MKKALHSLLLFAASTLLLNAGTPSLEKLQRGLVAFRTSSENVFLSWRLLDTDAPKTAFNVYRVSDGKQPVLLTEKPLAAVTSFTDTKALAGTACTWIVKPVVNGLETGLSGTFTLAANTPARNYLSIPLRTPDRYTPGDCSAGDLDGDGDYELVVHMTGVGRDNGQSGVTSEPILQAYKLDGTFLWEINLGKNIREGAHYTQFLVFDFDGDGKAEVMCKTADGTRDGLGNVLGDPKADWREQSKTGNMDPWRGFRGNSNWTMPDFGEPGPRADSLRQVWMLRQRQVIDSLRASNKGNRGGPGDENPLVGRIMSGPEYLTIFEGLTGKALATTDYVPGRGEPGVWGDDKGNRGERYLAGVACLDGKHPSAVMCRGYYARATLAAWDWDGTKLSLRWLFDSRDGKKGNKAYDGQGNHSLSVADVDGDGKDEIVYGAAVIDHNGKGLYSTGTGHGDALHCGDLDPEHPGLEVFQVHEDISHSAEVAAGHFRDAKTGQLIWGLPGKEDVGRGMCADIDPRFSGFECWSVASNGLYSAQGKKISDSHPRSCNFGIWWDGTPDRELLDKNTVFKWDWENGRDKVLFVADSCMSINGTKATPNLSADLFGDWREEIVLRTLDNKELRIFSTTIPTDMRLVTLMQDRQYRCAISWQNTAYNQPPYPGFYLGTGMKIQP